VPVQVLTDEDVARLSAAEMVEAARAALLQFGAGSLTAPPRVRASLGPVDYVFTAGALADGTSGFRCYRAGQPSGDQLTAVWEPSGRLRGVVVGDELGARRTGALGAVAADVLARADATTVGLIGSGVQAWTQLWALTAVRDVRRVSVYSRDPYRRRAFAERAGRELGLDAYEADRPGAAVGDITVLATRSTTPVLDAADVPPGTHVTTVGPKSAGGHEAPLELVARASVVTCDSPEQAAAYPAPFFMPPADLVSLAAVLCGDAHGRRSVHDITLHCSVGLAGSEVAIAQRLLTG
jgi:ornithine cyclodeaminase/alanine dehydrogenase-like protein (mu-crystallin family)